MPNLVSKNITEHKKLWLIIAVVVVVVIVAWLIFSGGAPDLPSAKAYSGEFIIDLKETGRLRAENSVTISAPPTRSGLQIVDIVSEGTVVNKGDFLIQFDTTDISQRIDDYLAELDIARSNLTRTKASIESNMSSLEASVANARASYRLSELRLDQMKFEADTRIEEGRLNLLQAELSLKQSEDKVKAQKQIDQEDIKSLELKVRQAELDLEKTYRELHKLTITAPGPGLVVYKEMWKGGEMTKVKVGDTPWRGMALIELPDLSVMLVETTVSEVDVAKVDIEQLVEIKLDAYPEPTFHGKVIDLATMAHSDNRLSDAKVFDVLVRIKESDRLLKPGMSASAQIIVDRLPDKVWVPIEAVLTHDGKSVVYMKSSRKWKAREVELGERNDNFVVIETGVEAGDIVALVDPTSDEASTGKVFEKPETKQQNNEGQRPKVRHRRLRH